MPSKTPKQHRFMEMVAHDPGAARRTGVPQSVAREFVEADERKKKRARKAADSGMSEEVFKAVYGDRE